MADSHVSPGGGRKARLCRMLRFKRVMNSGESPHEKGMRALTRVSMRSAEPSSKGVTWRRQLNGVTQGGHVAIC